MKRFIALLLVACAFATTAVKADPADPFAGYDLTYPPCNVSTEVRAARAGQKTAAATAATPSPSPRPRQTVTTQNGAVINKTEINGAALQNSTKDGTYSAIKNVPGVIDTQTKTNSGADSLQIRGIKLDNSASYRLDGALVLNNQINLPIEDKCRIEVLKGAGALEYGLAPPSGIVNYVIKRATDQPIAAVGFTGNGYGESIGSIDVGQRVGNNQQFGYRLNLAGGQTGAVAAGSGGSRYVGAFAGDWYIGNRAAVQVDVEQLGINLVEQASILENKAVKNVVSLPNVNRINPSNLLSGGTWSWSRGWEQNLAARFGYALAPNTTFIFQSGRSEADRPDRFVSQIGAYNTATGLGTETVTLVQDQDYVTNFYDAEIKTRTVHKWVSNELTLGFNENQRDFNDPTNPTEKYQQNIYQPLALSAPVSSQVGRTFEPELSHDADPYISDSISFFDRLRIIGGVRQIQYTEDDALAAGGTNTSVSSTLAPAAGIIYDVRPNVSVYASFVDSLQETGQAPASAVNAYQILPPETAQQKEVGIRANDVGVVTPTLAYFRISEANAVANPVTNIYAIDGTTTFEGLETTESIAATRLLAITLAGITERAIQVAPDDINGLTAENVPHLNYSIGASYVLPFAPQWSIDAARSYTSWRELNPEDQGTIPGYSLASAGVRWAKLIDGRHFELNIDCRNLLDKRYFSSAYSGNLGIGAPRTLTVTTRVGI